MTPAVSAKWAVVGGARRVIKDRSELGKRLASARGRFGSARQARVELLHLSRPTDSRPRASIAVESALLQAAWRPGRLEARPAGRASELGVEGYTEEGVGYHAYLLIDSGLAASFNGGDQRSPGMMYRVARLTSAGHDFAERARNEHIRDEVMERVKEKRMVSATIDVFKQLPDTQIRKRLELE